jgi:hypothetical protein
MLSCTTAHRFAGIGCALRSVVNELESTSECTMVQPIPQDAATPSPSVTLPFGPDGQVCDSEIQLRADVASTPSLLPQGYGTSRQAGITHNGQFYLMMEPKFVSLLSSPNPGLIVWQKWFNGVNGGPPMKFARH